MERCARLGSAYDPYPLDPNPPEIAHDHGALERTLALIFAALALIGFGILIGLSIRVSL